MDLVKTLLRVRQDALVLRAALGDLIDTIDQWPRSAMSVPGLAASDPGQRRNGGSPAAEALRSVGEAVAAALHVPWPTLISRDRHEPLATLRMVAMTAIRHHTHASARLIGELFGGRHHSSVLHAVRTVRDRVHCDLEAGHVEAGASDIARWLARASFAAAGWPEPKHDPRAESLAPGR